MALLTAAWTVPGRAQPPSLPLPDGITVERDLEYARVGDKRLLLDLYRPRQADAPLPVIVWVHGGGWQAGSKEQCRPALPYAGQGYAVASISYRLSGEATFPAQIEDCKAAVRWLRANAAKYNLDPARFGAWGSSAGGHLVALLGTSGGVKELEGAVGGNLDQSSHVQCVCDFYGPTDFVAFVTTPRYEGHARVESPESKLIGGAVLENKDKAQRANPIAYIGQETPPFFIVHGDADPVVPVGQSRLLHAALEKAGRETELRVLEGARHGGPEFVAPDVQRRVGEFFAKHLRPIQKKEPAATVEPKAISRPQSGLLFFPSYPTRDNTAAVANPHLIGSLVTIYWSNIEPQEGRFDWSDIDRIIQGWTDGGKKVGVRIMWSSSGNWPEPAAKHPTPQWVLDKGAVVAFAKESQTQIPLIWDPLWKQHAERFLREVARKFDGNPNVLFVDVTPGAETNPYRFRRINVQEPEFKQRFLDTAASDGRKYSHELWLDAVQQAVDTAAAAFENTPLLVTLNTGSLDGPNQMETLGDYCVAKGCLVGQNGLGGNSYLEDSDRKQWFQRWAQRVPLYFEMVDASGGRTGTLLDVMKAGERIDCTYLAVYARDVLKGTRGQPDFDPEYEAALQYGANTIGQRTASAPASPKAETRAEASPGFQLKGERWTYKDDAVAMEGIFLKPAGDGPFPAILISHGKGGSADSFGMTKAREFVKWGFICIAPGYTHARGAPMDRPPGHNDGASEENLRRAAKCLDILAELPYVDKFRIAAYGHSMGGFVTIGLAGTAPDRIKAAAISASGIAPRAGFPAPSRELAEKVRTPFLMLHGSVDRTVRPEQSADLKEILDRNRVVNQREVFEGENHPIDQTKRAEVFDLLRSWFEQHGVLK